MSEPMTATVAASAPPEVQREMESYRAELTGYAYRMLGSAFEAEDAVQETFVRAWRKYDSFEGRSALKSWLYRITTNVCLDMLDSSQRRARPMDMGPSQPADPALLGDPLPEATWLEPIPDDRVIPEGSDPAQVIEHRESIKLAFVAALQHLPPKQRAVLILREVLRWKAEEVAELMDTSVQSVNSALQRARAAIADGKVDAAARVDQLDDAQRALLERYVDAFQRYDMKALTALLHEDANWTMPPYALWLTGHDDIVKWCLGPGIGCDGSKLVAVEANGAPAFAQYKPDPAGGYSAWSVQVLDVVDDRIGGICFFLDTERFFPMFGLSTHID